MLSSPLVATAECGECKFCKSGKTNLCQAVRATSGKRACMPDGTTRFSYNGETRLSSLFIWEPKQCSANIPFARKFLAKSEPAGAADKACLLGCGVTGIGAVHNTAKSESGRHRCRFGLGAVLAGGYSGRGSAFAGREAVDTNPGKFTLAGEIRGHVDLY